MSFKTVFHVQLLFLLGRVSRKLLVSNGFINLLSLISKRRSVIVLI